MVNKVMLVGRWTKDIELRYSQKGTAVAKGTIACDGNSKDDETTFIPITMFGKQAENAAQYTGKGKMAHVEGRINISKFEGKDGNMVWRTDVIADRVKFLEFKSKDEEVKGTQEEAEDEEFPF